MANILITSTPTGIKLNMGVYSASPAFNGVTEIIFLKSQVLKIWKYSNRIEITFTDGNTFKFAHAAVAADPEVLIVDKVNGLPLGVISSLDALFDLIWGLV